MDPFANPLQQLGYQVPDLDRFVAELGLERQRNTLESLVIWPNESGFSRKDRVEGYGRLLAMATRSQTDPGIVDLLLDEPGLEPTVRPAQLLSGSQVLLAEGLSLGSGRNCRLNIPLWIWALYPTFAADLERGWIP